MSWRMVSRSWPVSSPSVMRPVISTMVTWLTSRVVMVIGWALGFRGMVVGAEMLVNGRRGICDQISVGRFKEGTIDHGNQRKVWNDSIGEDGVNQIRRRDSREYPGWER